MQNQFSIKLALYQLAFSDSVLQSTKCNKKGKRRNTLPFTQQQTSTPRDSQRPNLGKSESLTRHTLTPLPISTTSDKVKDSRLRPHERDR
ncbi:hypothetical protein K1719_032303 [Acacia pycnantha]|nr:hypothetical protein K1719_032303 [Acacia pycnantha]